MLSVSELKTFYDNLEDRPLEPDDPFYEAYLDKVNDPIKEIVGSIMWAQTDSVNLLSGQRGNGKSTELRRLRRLLEEAGNVVFLCDMRKYLNLDHPVEITDFLVSVMLAFSDAVQDKYKKDFTKRGYMEMFQDFLTKTNIEIKGIGAANGMSVALQRDPDFKRTLQNALRSHVSNFTQQAHDFAQEIVDFVRTKTDDSQKVVLLLDSVEQIRGIGTNAKAVHESVENLFRHHCDKLRLGNLHTVYTVPPYLPILAPAISQHLGGGILYQMPNVHVCHRDGTADPSGLSVMENIIQRRFSEWQQVFSLDQLQRIAFVMGGDFRGFFRFIRNLLLRASLYLQLPVEDIINKVAQDLRSEMLPIPKEDTEWLKNIARSHQAELESVEELPRLARFFDSNLVQNYRNGDDWYDLHPLVRDKIISSQ
jgi:energy-coupling factor transporter ATP-binding protein EcfA2